MMNNYGSYGWNGWMLMAMVLWPLLIAAGIWAVVALTRDRRVTPVRRRSDSPSDILKQRFARGEISQQEYVEAAAILDNDSSRAAHG
jgi:uncharacterized membrane protein